MEEDDITHLLNLLSTLQFQHPSYRLGQLLSNMDTWVRARANIDPFYISNDRLLEVLEQIVDDDIIAQESI